MSKPEKQSRLETGADVVSYLTEIVPAEIQVYEFDGNAWDIILKSQDINLFERSPDYANNLLNVVIAFVTSTRNNLDSRLRFEMKPSGEADLIPLQEGDREMLNDVIEKLDIFMFELLHLRSSSLGLKIFDKDANDCEDNDVKTFLREHNILQQVLSEQIRDIRLSEEAFEYFAATILKFFKDHPKAKRGGEEMVVTVGNLLEVPALVNESGIYRAVKIYVTLDADFGSDFEGDWNGDFTFWVPMEDIVLKPITCHESQCGDNDFFGPRRMVQ